MARTLPRRRSGQPGRWGCRRGLWVRCWVGARHVWSYAPATGGTASMCRAGRATAGPPAFWMPTASPAPP